MELLTAQLTPPPPLELLELEDELDDDELLDDELLLEDELELLLDELELLLDDELELLDEELPPTTPYGAGCDSQVLREIQLCWFSQPQPLCVVIHKGYSVPYQLHCSPVPPLELDDDELLLDELELDELLDDDEELEPPPLTVNEKELAVKPAPPCQISKPASISIMYQLELK